MDLSKIDRKNADFEQVYIDTLKKQYLIAHNNIQDDLARIYAKYSKDGKLDLSTMSVPDSNKISRLYKLTDSVNRELITLDQTDRMEKYLTDLYINDQKAVNDEIKKLTGVGLDVVNREAVFQSAISDLALISLKSNREAVVNNINMVITQSIVRGESIQTMAKGITKALENNANNAVRIARTETTRIMGKSRDESFQKIADEGLEVYKIWVSTNDSRTRDTHSHMQGEKIKQGNKFSNGLRYPSDPVGSASEVINCRCTMRSYFPEYEDEKNKPTKEKVKKEKIEKNVLSKDVKMQSFMQEKKAKKEFESFYKYINEVDGADKTMLKIYNNLDEVSNLKSYANIETKFPKNSHYVSRNSSSAFGYQNIEISIPKMSGSQWVEGRASTITHEMGHYIDIIYSTDDLGNLAVQKGITLTDDVLRNYSDDIMRNGLPKEIVKMQDDALAEYRRLWNDTKVIIDKESDEMYKNYRTGVITTDEYKKQAKALLNRYDESQEISRFAYKSVSAVEDIIDAITTGQAQAKSIVKYGHGVRYYSYGHKGEEIWANYCNLSIVDPKALDVLRNYYPKVIEQMDNYKFAMESLIK